MELINISAEDELIMRFKKAVCDCYEKLIEREINLSDIEDNVSILGTYAYYDLFNEFFSEALVLYEDLLSYMNYGCTMKELSEEEQEYVKTLIIEDTRDLPDAFDGKILCILEEAQYVIFTCKSIFKPTVSVRDLLVINSPLQEVW